MNDEISNPKPNVCSDDDNHGSPPSNHSNSGSTKNTTMFECNVCYDSANDPVITRCGHLYCWACIWEWLDRGNDSCPVCKGSVTQETVTPLYGRGEEDNVDPRTKEMPKRPTAAREESESGGRNGGAAGFNGGFFFMGGLPGLMMGGTVPLGRFGGVRDTGGYMRQLNEVGSADEPRLTDAQKKFRKNFSDCLFVLGVMLSLIVSMMLF